MNTVMAIIFVATIISIAAAKGWMLYQMDVYNAFLQGDLYEEVYMTIPEVFPNREKVMVKCADF